MMELLEQEYGCTSTNVNLGQRFENIIRAAYESTGQKVVILIDEYDKPLIDTIGTPQSQDGYRNHMRGIYGNLKKMDSYIKFAFLTGITRIGKLNIFSDLNNLKDLSLVSEFSGICGVTTDELHRYFHSGVKAFAQKRNCTIEEMYDVLRINYDGYHFAVEGAPDVYNPFSLLNALQDKMIGQYWFGTGTPLFLLKRIKSEALEVAGLNNVEVDFRQLENVPLDMKGDPIPILYQSGYLTIKGYNPTNGITTLGFPNHEVERGFMEQLMLAYPDSANNTAFSIIKFNNDIDKGDIDKFMRRLQSFFASINYEGFDLMSLEQHYQNVVYLLFKLLGYYTHTEYHTASGRIDLMMETGRGVYIFEFKLDKSAREALNQINSRDYIIPFQTDNRCVLKIGVNFSSKLKNISEWIVEPVGLSCR